MASRGAKTERRPRAMAAEGHDEAAAAWAQIMRLFLSQQERRTEVAAELGLAPTDLISLFHIQPSVGIAQRDLAEHWACDPSWVTTKIDRLEQLGFVERRPGAHDRRIKEVWLTAAGERARTRGMDGFHRPPDVLLERLSAADLRALARVLGKLDLPDPTVIATGAGAPPTCAAR